MLRSAMMIACIGLIQCSDETVAGYGGEGRTWVLSELDGAMFAGTATLTFPATGRIAGQAPCNGYQADMSAPYPWFETGPISTTRKTCPEMDSEIAFLNALAAMTQSEVSGNILILRTDDGREMVFTGSG